MGRLLVQVTHGPESPTRAALAVLLARTAADAGHEVKVFFVGDAVQLLRAEVIDRLGGLGTGSLADSFAGMRSNDVVVYASRLSSEARGLSAEDLPEDTRLALPQDLVELVFWADRTVTY